MCKSPTNFLNVPYVVNKNKTFIMVRVRGRVNCNNYNPAKIIISNRVAQIISLKLFL